MQSPRPLASRSTAYAEGATTIGQDESEAGCVSAAGSSGSRIPTIPNAQITDTIGAPAFAVAAQRLGQRLGTVRPTATITPSAQRALQPKRGAPHGTRRILNQ